MQFKAGMLGACIVVLALFGTILSGFFLGVEPATREVTRFDYITDVTGLFDVTQSPEYVEYSPSSNYVGYSPALAVDYTPSSAVNSYRYIVANGTTISSSYTAGYQSSFPSDTGRFTPAELSTDAYINWNGSINFGNTITNHGIDYNASVAGVSVQVGEYQSSMPMITSLARVINAFNLGSYDTLSVNITYGAMPVLIYYGNWTFTDIERGDGFTQYAYSATLNESNTMPDHLEISMSTLTVTASRGGVQMWNTNASNVDVIYRYSTRASGSFSPAENASATFAITAQTFPTYGYMDPTRGVSMDSYGAISTQTITSSQTYTAMSGLFAPPEIPYPDVPITQTVNLGTNTSNNLASTHNLVDTSFWGGSTRNVGLHISHQGDLNTVVTTNPDMPSRNVPDVGSLGGWMGYLLNYYYETDLTDYSVIDIDITRTGTYPSLIIPESVITVGSTSTNYQTFNVASGDWNNITPDTLTINCNTGLVVAYRSGVQMWTSDIDDIVIVNSVVENITLGSSFNMTLHGIPGANTGPSYPILYIDNTDEYGGNWSDYLTISGADVNTAVYMDTGTNTLQITSLQSVFDAWGLSNVRYYEISFDQGDYPIFMHPKQPAIWSMIELGTYSEPWARYYYQAGNTLPYTVIDSVEYNNGIVRAYIGDTLTWTASPADVWVVYKYCLLDGSSAVPAVYQESVAPVSVTATIKEVTAQTAIWANGYQNDDITITVQRYDLNGNELTIRAGSSYASIAINESGNITVTDGNQTLNMGAWRGIQLNINATDGYLRVTPSNSLSFTAPIEMGATTKSIDNWYSGGTITSLAFSTTGQSPYWQITRTTVFLDTFNAVMNDPALDITQYFPDLENWRLNFFSFATYGDSMTINNVLFTVNRLNGTVTWELPTEDDETVQYTQTLTNIYISNKEVNGSDHLILTFVNNGSEYDLGEKVSNTVSFGGLWFFTTGLYDAVTVIESYYDWQLDSAFHIDGNQALFIFLGLLVFGAIVTKGLFHMSFKSLDGIILIGAGLIITLLIGGL